MSTLFGPSLSKLVVILILFSILNMNESRFVWDFGSYCIKHCAKIKFKLSAINICSCQWISSNHRQATPNTISSSDDNDPYQPKKPLIE